MLLYVTRPLFIVFLLISVPVVSGAGGEGIPIGFLLAQVFNFSLFVLILFFILKKKIPPFLRQKQEDFLAYRQKAKALEQKYQADCRTEQEKIHHLANKQKTIKTDVARAISQREKEMAEEMEQSLKNLKSRAQQSLKRARLKETHQLKSWLLSQVMAQTKAQIKMAEPAKKEQLNHHIVQKWRGSMRAGEKI